MIDWEYTQGFVFRIPSSGSVEVGKSEGLKLDRKCRRSRRQCGMWKHRVDGSHAVIFSIPRDVCKCIFYLI